MDQFNIQEFRTSLQAPQPTTSGDAADLGVAAAPQHSGLALIERFREVLSAASAPAVRDPRLQMDGDTHVKVYYAPFEYINPTARVVLVGITPGPTQMVNANNEARRALLAGRSASEAVKLAKSFGAFSGEPMRSNLIKQLNDWGFHRWLGIDDASALFTPVARHFLHTTSLLRYPVFVNGKDYRGTPDMTRHPVLRKYLLQYFVSEVALLNDALFVGLGPQVQKTLAWLTAEGVLPSNRVVSGMLHPSGNCTYRINYLVGDRVEAVPHATNPQPYDRGRRAFQELYLSPNSGRP